MKYLGQYLIVFVMGLLLGFWISHIPCEKALDKAEYDYNVLMFNMRDNIKALRRQLKNVGIEPVEFEWTRYEEDATAG